MNYLQGIIYLALVISCQSAPIENNNKQESKFILAAIDHTEELPQNAIEVNHHLPKGSEHDDHILNSKKIVAIPASHVKPDTNILINEHGKPVVAEHTDNSDEDMVTADNIVFRPLFTYKKQLAQRRRVYLPENYNRRVYVPVYYYPQYRPTQYKDVAFPVLP